MNENHERRIRKPHMTNETKARTPTIQALLRSQDHLPVDDIREMTKMVSDFADRCAAEYFKDRSASRTRKNVLTIGIAFLCFASGIGLIISALLGQPVGQAITSLNTLLNAVGSAFLYFANRK